MRRTSFWRPYLVTVGLVVVLGLVTYFAFHPRLPFSHGYRVDAMFQSSSGLRKGSPVRIAGVDVGKVVKAQQIYREDDKDGNGILDYAVSFQDLGALGLLHIPPMKKGDQVMVVEGYKFRIVRADTLYWAADGAPAQPGQSGDVYLFVDQTGVIRGEKDKPAGPGSPPVK